MRTIEGELNIHHNATVDKVLVVDIYRNSRGAKIADYAATFPDWIAPNHDTGQILKTVHGLGNARSRHVQVQPSKGVQPGQVDSGQLVAKELQFLEQAQLVKLGWEGTQFVTPSDSTRRKLSWDISGGT